MGKPEENSSRHDLSTLSTHLRDLNVFDKQKLPPVIHGRKASTYLRLFQDDENSHRSEQAGSEGSDQKTEPTAWKSPFQLTKNFVHGHKHEHRMPLSRRHSFSASESYQKSSRRSSFREKNPLPIHSHKSPRFAKKAVHGPNARRCVQQPTEGLPLQHQNDSIPEGIAYPEQQPALESTGDKLVVPNINKDIPDKLVLKPISSATYYPHQSKDNALEVTAPTTLARSAPSIPQAAPIENSLTQPKIHHEPPIMENLDPTEKPDTKFETRSDSKSEDDVYPLAVELQPFTNKVGGHTAIFRFSERAVCKALVSRENMWYENIEQQHKELLQFIPRYIGVLNVRQHFNSKEEFLKEVEHEKMAKLTKKQQKLDSFSGKGQSQVPVDLPSPPLAMKNPEVLLDDNKHMIPDSLWYKYSHSPESAPSDSFLSSHSFEDRGSRPWDSGSTVVNTKLQELVLQEVFAPTKRSNPTRISSMGERHRPLSSASSTNLFALKGDRRNSEETKPPTIVPPSPTNSKAKPSLANAIDSHSSVLDLKQFNMRKLAQIDAENKKSSGTEELCSQTSFHDNLNEHPDDDGVFAMEEDCQPTKEESNNESVSFEENSHTIVSKFILLEDLTRKLDKPCVLDLKMGTRQYGVNADKFKRLSQSKKCRQTTSRKLGVRICGLKIWNKDYYIKRDKYFGRRVKIGWQFARALARFLYDGEQISSIIRQIPQLLSQLDKLYAEIVKLKGYRLYGSSLLLIYDGNCQKDKRCTVKVNLIDFAQCVTSDDIALSWDSFRIPPKSPDTEDRGFLRGVRSLKFYLQSVWNHLTNDSNLLYGNELDDFINNNPVNFNKPWDWLDNFDKESELDFSDEDSDLRKKWRKYELIFDVEPRYMDDAEVSE